MLPYMYDLFNHEAWQPPEQTCMGQRFVIALQMLSTWHLYIGNKTILILFFPYMYTRP